MISLHVFTEEASAKILFDILLPKILPENTTYRIYAHQGKQDLEKALKDTVPSISKIPGARILITRDQDFEDCIKVKKTLIDLLNNKCNCDYFVRVICKELEAWFIGDMKAIEKAYPRFKTEKHKNKSELKDSDNIDYPSKVLLKLIPELSDKKYLPKLEVAGKITPYIDLEKNTSKSFQNTLKSIKILTTNN